MQEAHRKGTGGAQPCAAGDIRCRCDFHPVKLRFIEHAVENPVLDLWQLFHQLIFGVFQQGIPAVEIWVNRDIAVAINGCAQHTAAILFIKIRKITAAAGEADAKWRLSDNHSGIPPLQGAF